MPETAEPTMTKGEALLLGLDQIKEGLNLIGRVNTQADLLKVLVTSDKGARQLREVLGAPLLKMMVLGLVKAKNSRLSEDTVEKVVTDFLNVLCDLAQPYKVTPKPAVVGQQSPGK
ncbi:MAG: hypothetical protein ACM3ZU_08195 [Bacteroidota bacterium]